MSTGDSLLSGWVLSAASGYTSGNSVYLSMKVGSGFTAGDLSLWHYDGSNWTSYAASDFVYDGTYANFTVTGFSGFAVSAVPEPATLVLLVLSVIGIVIVRFRKN